MSAKSQHIAVDGVKTHYLEAGSGAPMVLIHGGGAGADARGNWSGCLPAFAERYRVLAVDMLGFGATDKPDPASHDYSQGARNRHLLGFLDALGLDAPILVGNSMGGCTALGVAIDRPDRVRALVLMGSAGLNAELSPAIRTILGYQPTPENMRTIIDTLTGDGFVIDEELVRYRYELTQQPGAMAAYGATMKWIGEQGGLFYAEEEIARVKTPTLVVNGSDDQVVPKELAWRFHELLDNSWLYVIPHCGHWAMIEQREEFTHVVGTWCALRGLA